MDKLQYVKQTLGEPYFETENFLLYNMDALEGMRKIKDKIFNLTVTSPPYNIGKEYEEVMPVSDYINWCTEWIRLIYETTEKNGSLLLNIGYLKVPEKGLAVPISYLLWDKSDFYLMQEIVWNYGAGVACKKKLSPRNEKILWFLKDKENYIFNLDDIRDKNVKYPNQKKNGKLRCNTLGKNPSDVWQIAKVTSGKNRSSKERTAHPAQFPADMIERLIKGFSNKGDLVLDPFIGSGTTAEVAINNGRKVIGFEVSKDYCDYTVDRIKRLNMQKDLYDFNLDKSQ